MLLESSILLLENIYGKGITYDRQNIFIVLATGDYNESPWLDPWTFY
jgi:hypothetical protein